MSSNDGERQVELAHLHAGWAPLLAAIGAAVLYVSHYFGKVLCTAEIVYDLGVAILTVALIDFLILRFFAVIAARHSELERRLAAELRILDQNAAERLAKWDENFKNLKLDILQTSIDRVSGIVDAQGQMLQAIYKKIP